MGQDLERFVRRHELVGSTLALAAFLEPVLDAAQQQAQARQRRRSTPPLGGATAQPDARDADREETVAAVAGRRLHRMGRPPIEALTREPAEPREEPPPAMSMQRPADPPVVEPLEPPRK